MLSEKMRKYVAKLERVARAAKEATEIYQIGFSNSGEALAWKHLLAALTDLPDDALGG